MLVSQYASKFIQLSRLAPDIIATKNKKAQKFLKGLRANIFDRVAMMRSNTYIEALEHSQLIKELLITRYRHIHNVIAQYQ